MYDPQKAAQEDAQRKAQIEQRRWEAKQAEQRTKAEVERSNAGNAANIPWKNK